MRRRRQLLSFTLSLLVPSVLLGEASLCPGNSVSAPYRSLARSQIGILVSINHSDPYDFVVDTGAQMTVIDSDIANDLNLQSQGHVELITLDNDRIASMVRPALVEAGPVTAHDLPVVVEGVDQIHALNPKVRGILGENFLGRFDLLIDYKHKIICFDESKSMQRELQGERVPMIRRQERSGDFAYTQPLDVTVHIPDDRKKGIVLRLDSGTYIPILFDSRLAARQRLQSNSSVMMGKVAYVAIPEMSVSIGFQTIRLIEFGVPGKFCTS
jgi:predicted aspartyl protease